MESPIEVVRRFCAAWSDNAGAAELAGLIADGHLEVPIANLYPLAQVREAYTELERRHTHGKIVLTLGVLPAPG